MIYFLATLIVLTYVGTLVLLFRLFERLYFSAIAERDKAIEDMKTLRAALFPQLARIGAEQAPKRAQAGATPPQSSHPPAFSPMRTSWRNQFKTLVRQHNTKQIGRDLMADAISKAPQPAAKEASHG